MGQIENYLDWLDSEIQGTGTYHHHKEIMAWTATAFYSSAVIVLAYTAAPQLDSGGRLILSVLLFFLGYFTTMFVNMQFEARWTADETIKGLMRAKGLLAASQELPEKLKDVPSPSVKKEEVWPVFIQEQINLYQTARLKEFKSAFRLVLKPHRWREIKPRVRTELPSYVVILIATFLAIASLWGMTGTK